MIEIIPHLPDDVVGFRATGKVTGLDYESVLVPLVEERLQRHPKIKLLYHLGPEFSGFEAEAMWDDAKVGLQHFTAWQKIALVSDVGWIRGVMKIFGFAMPGHVRIFSNAELDSAREWVCS